MFHTQVKILLDKKVLVSKNFYKFSFILKTAFSMICIVIYHGEPNSEYAVVFDAFTIPNLFMITID